MIGDIAIALAIITVACSIWRLGTIVSKTEFYARVSPASMLLPGPEAKAIDNPKPPNATCGKCKKGIYSKPKRSDVLADKTFLYYECEHCKAEGCVES